MSSDVQASSGPEGALERLLPWAFVVGIWFVWITDLALAFAHEDCVGCLQLRIVLILLIVPVAATTIAVARGWFSGAVSGSTYVVGGAFLILLLLALIALLS